MHFIHVFIGVLFRGLLLLFRNHDEILVVNLMLRHQLASLMIQRKKAQLDYVDRVLFVQIKQVWEKWKNALVVVKPETVIRWERARFQKYWRDKSKSGSGRKRILGEIRSLIKRIASENNWGAGKI